jgi:hypothetical protein
MEACKLIADKRRETDSSIAEAILALFHWGA